MATFPNYVGGGEAFILMRGLFCACPPPPPPMKIYAGAHGCMAQVIRTLIKLPYKIYNYLVFGIVESITVKLDRHLVKFVYSIINSKHSTVRELIAYFLRTESSVFADNCRYLMYKYDKFVFAWHESLYDIVNCINSRVGASVCDTHLEAFFKHFFWHC